MRYVVTGAAGFIGHHVCGVLLGSGHEVDGVDSFTDYYDPSLKRANDRLLRAHARYRCHELDLVTTTVDDLLVGADAVIHLAGQPGVRLSWADGFQVYVDRNSTQYLSGSEIDYLDTLMGAGFTVNNPNAVAACGCGSSFRTADDAGTARSCAH